MREGGKEGVGFGRKAKALLPPPFLIIPKYRHSLSPRPSVRPSVSWPLASVSLALCSDRRSSKD